ncbi:hypothetical protein HMPREF2533_04069 [Bacteroides fragilis]|nr:hypothetical protein HMPREF2530_04069 [Bacteroides fragilis]KXU41571.1 hypothetical protein HMPREF2533_04069 [Bacteroides fragilis]
MILTTKFFLSLIYRTYSTLFCLPAFRELSISFLFPYYSF